ncbi:helix-turn-helix domain-containing protein [Ruminococcaceae bacterium OttesenSCG-928-D13]|nr:helix-turn-helix domain-containing protein [Ruminococcaceae bacterium OttesenSCG-928-D13]
MKKEVTLPEKLKDLRVERKMKLAEVSDAVGIPVSTLQRIEGQEDMRVGYQDVAALAKYYGVSCDYLFGLTDNEQYRNVEIDRLRLSDAAIAVLVDGNMNHRLLSELMAHRDFPALMRALEIYVDRKVLPQMNNMNAMYKFAEQTIRDNLTIEDDDEVMALLQEAVVDEDDYLRQKISERFNDVVRALFAAHKKDALDEKQSDELLEMKDLVKLYLDEKEGGREEGRAKVTVFAKQIGLNVSGLSDDEILLLTRVLERSQKYRRTAGKRRGKRKK